MLADFEGYYRSLPSSSGRHRFEPSRHVQGAWRTDEQHMAPVSGLIAHCLQQHEPRPELRLCRISYDILGVIGAAETEVTVSTVRAGRTIELVAAELSVAGRVAVRAGGWRLLRSDTTAIAIPTDGDSAGAALPDPDRCRPWDARGRWPGGYIESVEVRQASERPAPDGSAPDGSAPDGSAPDGSAPDGSGAETDGPVRAWIGTRVPLLADAEVDPVAGYCGLVDTANGIGARLDPRRWAFPNTDLTVHLAREPEFSPDPDGRRWVGLEVSATLGPDGIGITSSTLHDRRGPLGRAEQILTLRRLG